MNPESITVSLDMAKKLKEAGWPQEDGIFHWKPRDGNVRLFQRRQNVSSDAYAAPTAEEILGRLPVCVVAESAADELTSRAMIFDLYVKRVGDVGWRVVYLDLKTGQKRECLDTTLANAAAAMTCYLVEQGLLSLKND